MVQHRIEVDSKEQGTAVDKALANKVAKAAVVVIGVMSDLSAVEQERVLKFVTESLGVITGD